MATTATTTPAPNLTELIEAQRRIVARQQYRILGQVDKLYTTAGMIDFRKDGPKIGRANETGQLVIVSPYMGLPPLQDASLELCQTCRAKCDECKNGMRTCIRCGGRGHLEVGSKPCPGPKCVKKTGKFNGACDVCKGSGGVPQTPKCEACKGTGKAECGLCLGTGRRSTGIVRGKVCTACNGNMRKPKTKAQDIKDFMAGTIPGTGLYASAPISALLWFTLGGYAEAPSHFVSCQVLPDAEKQLMHLLLDRLEPGAQCFLLGGVPNYKE